MAQRFAHNEPGGDGNVEGTQAGAHRDREAGIGQGMNGFGHAGTLAAEEERVGIAKFEIRVRAISMCGEQD